MCVAYGWIYVPANGVKAWRHISVSPSVLEILTASTPSQQSLPRSFLGISSFGSPT